MLERLFRRRPGEPSIVARLSAVPLNKVRSVQELAPNPLVYERTALMEHVRRYDRETLRAHYLRQPDEGARVWANYVVNLWEYEHGVEELTSYPWNVTIPMTEVCNATCTFCSSPLMPDPQALAVSEVRHFSDALRHAVRVSLQGLGEPMAHPQFEAIVAEIRQYLSPVAQVEIITNGWLLSGPRWTLLKSLGLSDIQVSVNAATDRTHQIAMGSRPGTFDRVVRNIEDVLADPEWPWPDHLKVSMVVTRHSLPEVPKFLEMFAKKGVQRFQLNPLLPLTSSDWGFGRTAQYRDLWCGHLPEGPALVEAAVAAIAKYGRRGIRITATPEQWLLPVDTGPIQLPPDQQQTAAFQAGSPSVSAARGPSFRVDGRDVELAAHAEHTHVISRDEETVRFRGTSRSRRWAYLLRTPQRPLAAGAYTLELQIEIASGELYAGVLDVDGDDFIVQEPVGPGTTQIKFALAERRVVAVVVRQGADDTPVVATYRDGRLRTAAGIPQPVAHVAEAAAPPPEPPALPSAGEPPVAPSSGPVKPGRIYCPMVYTTLSVFHHSLEASICCYMEHAPGHGQPSLKAMSMLQAYNHDGFRLVRRTLNTDRHVPVCDSCPYGGARS